MTEQVKANLITSYIVFVHDFADPTEINKSEIEKKMHCKLEDLFKRQRVADMAKSRLGEDFKKAVSLYFHRFQTKDGFNHKALLKDLDSNEEALVRHLKKDSVKYVRLLAQLMTYVDTGPRGLLAS